MWRHQKGEPHFAKYFSRDGLNKFIEKVHTVTLRHLQEVCKIFELNMNYARIDKFK